MADDNKYKYLGGGNVRSNYTVKKPALSDGWKNIKAGVGEAFDFFKKKKKKPEDEL